ncbi:MAG: HNH endonuclease [Chitinophagaceae bacterium]|nr:HNH endonuclease [Chitinophagaceae bacterium]
MSELCIFCFKQEATTRDHIFPKQFVKPPVKNNYIIPLCAKCNNTILSQAEEVVRNSISYSLGCTYRAQEAKVAAGLRAQRFSGKIEKIKKTNPLGLGTHIPKLKKADDADFGKAVKNLVRKMIIGLEFTKKRLADNKFEVTEQRYVFDIPINCFKRTFESRGFCIWEYKTNATIMIAEKIGERYSEYGFYIWWHLLLFGRINYLPPHPPAPAR